MTGLILGQSVFNASVQAFLKEKGYRTVIVEDVAKVRGLWGQIGDFILELEDQHIKADFIILTQQPEASKWHIGGGTVPSIYDEMDFTRKDFPSPIVFLTDYIQESSVAATIKGLTDAKTLAEKKGQVYYLARFVRTGAYNMEALYIEARNAGVTFIKYETLYIAYDDHSDFFTITANDGVFDVEIQTKRIYGDGGAAVGAESKYGFVAKKLRLQTNAHGFLLEDQYFLSPVFTSRKGVFHINSDVGYERLEEGLHYIVSMVEPPIITSENTGNTAMVDQEKCVLCYTCYRACPHAAMTKSKDGRHMENLAMACGGCGICASLCPGGAISLEEKDLGISVPDSSKILLLCCENSGEAAYKKILPALGPLAAMVAFTPVPCGGAISKEALLQGLSAYGKVMVAVCMTDSCRHFSGNNLACRQTDRVKALLKTSGLPDGKVAFIQVSHAMPKVLKDAVISFVEEGNH